jgi:hypothetical protein
MSKIDNAQFSQSLEWIKRGETVSYDDKFGTLRKVEGSEKIWRFVPKYSKAQDLAVARFLIKEVANSLPSCVNTGANDANYSQKVEAAEIFLKKILNSYSNSSQEIYQYQTNLQRLIHAYRLQKTFKIPYEVLKANPEFIDFAAKNHLESRIDETYQNRGLGIVTSEDGKICLMKRDGQSHQSYPVEWDQLFNIEKGTLDQEGKIKEMELMAYGWEAHHTAEVKSLEPFKMITADSNEAEYAIELVTANPTYNLNNVGLGMFGHSWIRMYAPVLDSEGQPTNQRLVYSIGYNLKDVVVPDIFEFIKRKTISTKIPLTKENFEIIKNEMDSILFCSHATDQEKQNMDLSVKNRIESWLETNCITCSSFASEIFKNATGKQVDGKILSENIFTSPKFYQTKNIQYAPVGLSTVFSAIKFLTCGQFPTFMVSRQQQLNAELASHTIKV